MCIRDRVRDDATRPEPGQQFVEPRVVHRDVTAATCGVSRAGQRRGRQMLVDEGDRILGEGNRLGAHRVEAHLVDERDHVAHGLQTHHGRCSAEPAADALGGLVALPLSLIHIFVSTAPRGSDAVATMAASFTEDGVRLRTAAYLAVLRTYFTRATLASGPGTITVTLEYVPAN